MTTPTVARPVVPARRTADIRYAVRDVILLADEARAAGREMLYLNIGDPNIFDFAPPHHMLEATFEAMRENRNGYAPSSGIPEAIDSIKRRAEADGIRNIRHVAVTSGASEAIEIALAALVNPGDNVLTPSPGYPLYTAVLAKLEAEARPYHLDEGNGWQPDPADIAANIDDRTRAIVLINPNNPTGSVASREVLQAIVDICVERDIMLFSDEIYDQLVFDGAHTATASLAPDAKIITFNGLSKAYVVPGFRIGWGIVSGPERELEDFCEAMRKMERARLSANHPEQYAIPAALDGPQDHITEMMTRLRRRRDITTNGLNAIDGISCVTPGGAFYAFPRLELGIADDAFCARVIRETGVVIVPGSGFGQREGTQHFRVVFLPPEEVLEKAFDRIGAIARDIAG